MEKNFYVEVTLKSDSYQVLIQNTTLFDYQSALDCLKDYVDYLRNYYPAAKATMVGSFLSPRDSSITIFAKQLINGELFYLGFRKFTYYGK